MSVGHPRLGAGGVPQDAPSETKQPEPGSPVGTEPPRAKRRVCPNLRLRRAFQELLDSRQVDAETSGVVHNAIFIATQIGTAKNPNGSISSRPLAKHMKAPGASALNSKIKIRVKFDVGNYPDPFAPDGPSKYNERIEILSEGDTVFRMLSHDNVFESDTPGTYITVIYKPGDWEPVLCAMFDTVQCVAIDHAENLLFAELQIQEFGITADEIRECAEEIEKSEDE
jgi:hypothetical protein